MINFKDIDNLAELSRLGLSSEEKESYVKDLNSILDYVGELNKVELNSEAKTYESDTVNTMRDDIVTNLPGVCREDLLNSANETENGYIKVKKILN